jgi:hypothetical protein
MTTFDNFYSCTGDHEGGGSSLGSGNFMFKIPRIYCEVRKANNYRKANSYRKAIVTVS